MKIKNNITRINLTFDEAYEAIRKYQRDMLSEIYAVVGFDKLGKLAQVDFMYNLIKGDKTKWFTELIETHGIPWIGFPAFKDDLIVLVEDYPHIFGIGGPIDEAMDKDSSLTHENFEIIIGDTKINSKKLIDNI